MCPWFDSRWYHKLGLNICWGFLIWSISFISLRVIQPIDSILVKAKTLKLASTFIIHIILGEQAQLFPQIGNYILLLVVAIEQWLEELKNTLK